MPICCACLSTSYIRSVEQSSTMWDSAEFLICFSSGLQLMVHTDWPTDLSFIASTVLPQTVFIAKHVHNKFWQHSIQISWSSRSHVCFINSRLCVWVFSLMSFMAFLPHSRQMRVQKFKLCHDSFLPHLSQLTTHWLQFHKPQINTVQESYSIQNYACEWGNERASKVQPGCI